MLRLCRWGHWNCWGRMTCDVGGLVNAKDSLVKALGEEEVQWEALGILSPLLVVGVVLGLVLELLTEEGRWVDWAHPVMEWSLITAQTMTSSLEMEDMSNLRRESNFSLEPSNKEEEEDNNKMEKRPLLMTMVELVSKFLLWRQEEMNPLATARRVVW